MAGTLAAKLLLKPGMRGAVVNAPAGFLDRLRPFPEGAAVGDRLEEDLDFVLVFAADRAGLERHVGAAGRAAKPDGLIWVAYRKGGRKAGADLNRDVLWAAMGEQGLTGVTLVAIDDEWSAMRFRRPDQVGR